MCATFGAGVSSACVVDVGDQKTSVSCVEDGLSLKNTRYAALLSHHFLTKLILRFIRIAVGIHIQIPCRKIFNSSTTLSNLKSVFLDTARALEYNLPDKATKILNEERVNLHIANHNLSVFNQPLLGSHV